MGTKIRPIEGQVYTHRDGNRYLCMAELEDNGATMERVTDGWTLDVFDIYRYAGGFIDWGYVTRLRWAV